MRSFQNHGTLAGDETFGRVRLDTPTTSGFRRGMTSTGVIARKLEAIYDVPAEPSVAIDSALNAIDRSLGASK